MRSKIKEFKSRRLAIISDDNVDPERAIIVAPAHQISVESINSLFSITGGLPFVAITPERAEAFMISEMARPRVSNSDLKDRPDPRQLLSVEAREGVSTGISASDRAITVGILGEEQPNPRKLVRPGHIFPVQVKPGGVLVKSALPEAALDLVQIGNFTSAALFLDLLGPDGGFATRAEIEALSSSQKIPVIKLSELIRYRLETEALVERVAEAALPTHSAGELRSIIYRSKFQSGEHLALVKGELHEDAPILTRVQPENTFSDVFGGTTNPSRTIIHRALSAIGNKGCGVLVYLRKPESLSPQFSSEVQNVPRFGPSSMMREYGLGAQILRDLGVKRIELLTGSKKNLVGLKTFGIEIVAQRSIPD